MRLGRM